MRQLLCPLFLLMLIAIGPAVAQDNGEDFGVTGIMVVKNGQFPSAASVLPHSPAADAGIEPGDTILATDGVGVADLGLNEFVAKMRGKPGSEVVLAVLSHEAGVAFSFTLKRVSARAYHEAHPPN